MVAILIFAVGAGLSFYEGIIHYRDPEELRDPTVNYIVLGAAFLLEGTSWSIAVREFLATKGDAGWWIAVRQSKDPAVFIVMFEDSAALIGLIVAALGVFSSHWFDAPRLDGVASMVIGVVLALVAAFLAREAKGLLIGESADLERVDQIRTVVAQQSWVTRVNHVRTIHTSPKQVFVAISADLEDAITMGEGERLIEDLEQELKSRIPELSSIYIRPEKQADALAMPEVDGERR